MTKKELKKALTQISEEIKWIEIELKDAKKGHSSKWSIKSLEKELGEAIEKQMNLLCEMIDNKY